MVFVVSDIKIEKTVVAERQLALFRVASVLQLCVRVCVFVKDSIQFTLWGRTSDGLHVSSL